MPATRWFDPDLAYLKTLIGAGLNGISTAKSELGGRVFTPPLQAAVWKPLAVGAAVGALGTRLKGDRRPGSIAAGSLLGSLIGFGAALAWTSRTFTGSAGRKAVHLVNATRDAHWLESNPIDYA